MHITSKDIAKVCGVSRGTVDRALNNRGEVNEETKRRILETAEQLGYRPHHVASSLAKGKTFTLGLVLFDVNNRFFAELVNAIESKARTAGYFVYLTLTNKDPELEKQCLEHLVSRQVDGILLCPIREGLEYEEYLKSLRIPVITVGNRLSTSFSFVGINDFEAGRSAADHILKAGYKRIIYVCPPLEFSGKNNIYAQKQRFEGFSEAVKSASTIIEQIVISKQNYLSQLEMLLLEKEHKTVVFCPTDIYALEVLRHFRIKGLEIPENFGLMGFDGIDVLKYMVPSLTSVKYPIDAIAAQAVNYILRQINGEAEPGEILLPHEIIQGHSL